MTLSWPIPRCLAWLLTHLSLEELGGYGCQYCHQGEPSCGAYILLVISTRVSLLQLGKCSGRCHQSFQTLLELVLYCCSWANAAAAAFIILTPTQPQLYAAVYALADGPLAGALIVWQSAWVFGSASHSIR